MKIPLHRTSGTMPFVLLSVFTAVFATESKILSTLSGQDDYVRLCKKVDVYDPTSTMNTQEPMFLSVDPAIPGNQFVDNACISMFPVADPPNSVQFHISFVYADHSNRVEKQTVTLLGKGTQKIYTDDGTFISNVIGYAGCNTHVGYSCRITGDFKQEFAFASTMGRQPISQSCLDKMKEILKGQGIPPTDYRVFPGKLASRCVTESGETVEEVTGTSGNTDELPPLIHM